LPRRICHVFCQGVIITFVLQFIKPVIYVNVPTVYTAVGNGIIIYSESNEKQSQAEPKILSRIAKRLCERAAPRFACGKLALRATFA